MIWTNLFVCFFKISLFSIGGAYSFYPLLERELVGKYKWLTNEEFLDIMGITKTIPGAISIKYATYVGYKIAGFPGVIIANLGNLIPPLVLIILISAIYNKYRGIVYIQKALKTVELVILAMILAMAYQLMMPLQVFQLKNLWLVVLSFFLLVYAKFNPYLLIIIAGVIGGISS